MYLYVLAVDITLDIMLNKYMNKFIHLNEGHSKYYIYIYISVH